MKRHYLIITAVFVSIVAVRCGSDRKTNEASNPSELMKTDTIVLSTGTNTKGIGRFKDIQLTHPLDEAMIAKADPLYNAKCFACHKLTDEKLVGPGWKGVTDRRTPEWIMNFLTNTQVMLDKDLSAQSMLVTCLVRMPSQDLSDDDARAILEMMRKNDGKK